MSDRPRGADMGAQRTRRLAGAMIAAGVVGAAAVAGGGGLGAAPTRSGSLPVTRLAGTWQALPAAPITPSDSRIVGVWTGREVVMFDRVASALPDTAAENAAVAYNPASRTWRKLTPPRRPGGNYEGSYVGAWTGKEVLIGGPLTNFAYNPATDRWRTLPANLGGPMAVWTGRAMISWGGGCCGDASAEGSAYNPTTNRARALPASPLAPAQHPIGVWTGREVIILISGLDPNGKAYPAAKARAAAYNPATNTWRRVAPIPVTFGSPRAVWDGQRLLVLGAGQRSMTTLSYNPTTNGWRVRAGMPSRFASGSPVVWAGRRAFVWRGRNGMAYNPASDRWTVLPEWPFGLHPDATLVWTGGGLVVWGFDAAGGTDTGDGATFTPAVP